MNENSKLKDFMKTLLSIAKLFSITVVAGAVGAGALFLALDSDDLVGAASGKKAAKRKAKQNKSVVWEDIAKDLAPVRQNPIPNADIQQEVESPGSVPVIEAPNGPLLDQRNPALCAERINSMPVRINGGFFSYNGTRTITRGEVRGFHQYPYSSDILCEVEIYPTGCDRTFHFVVHSTGLGIEVDATNQHLCTSLSQGYFHNKEIVVQGYSIPEAPENAPQFLHRVYFSPRPLAELLQLIEASEQRIVNNNVRVPSYGANSDANSKRDSAARVLGERMRALFGDLSF